VAQRSDHSALRALVADGTLDAELAALLWLLAEQGVPLAVASRSAGAGAALAAALPGVTGTLLADSLDEVVRLAGARRAGELPDELRELGVLAVVREIDGRPRVVAAHYVRPLERDAGGHVQRRGPAVLATWDERSATWQHFAWGVAAELAERSGLALPDFERRRQAVAESLLESADGGARHRH
jgi:hypothetical protein